VDFITRTTQATSLKATLDQNAERMRSIADRVARAGRDGFVLPEPGATAAKQPAEPVDLEAEMSRLADAQLRFDAAATLLQKTYAGLRASLRER
jgi:flagellar basal body rod protein FlgB